MTIKTQLARIDADRLHALAEKGKAIRDRCAPSSAGP